MILPRSPRRFAGRCSGSSCAGAESGHPLEFLARLVTHIPNPGQVMTRYYGWYASRTRGTRRRQAGGGEAAAASVELADWSLRAAR